MGIGISIQGQSRRCLRRVRDTLRSLTELAARLVSLSIDSEYYVPLIPEKGMLAGDIVGFQVDLPEYGMNLEIVGNNKRFAVYKEFIERKEEDDYEDCSDELVLLPTIVPDPSIHFLKCTSYKSEIHNLLQCRESPYVVQLLENGR